jgi:uncharacterized protein YacL
MSTDFIIRLIGMVFFSIIGVSWGTSLGRLANQNPTPTTLSVEQYAITIGLVGALTGIILTPFITTRPIRALRSLLSRISAQMLFSALLGLIVGLLIAALLAFPISLLPDPFGAVLPFVGVVVFGYLGVAIFAMRQAELFSVVTDPSSRY